MRPPTPPAGYALVREIGSGGFGSVWLARSQTGLWRAVKIVASASEDDRELFRRELAGITRFQAAALGQPTQLAILHVEADDAEGSLRYVMELADDASGAAAFSPETYVPLTLKELRRRRGRLPVAEVARIGMHVARALALLHEAGLLHRDVKPSNIILVGGVPKLGDLGLVTSSDTAVTRVGTQGYVAPEGPGTQAADLYSLGLVLYELATNQPPGDFPCLPPGIAGWADAGDFGAFNEILLRLCSHDPRGRHASARALADDLAAFLAGRSITSIDRSRRQWRRRGIASLIALAASCAGLGVLVREAQVARDREALAAARVRAATAHAFPFLQASSRAAAQELWRSTRRPMDAFLPAAFFEGQLAGDPCTTLARSPAPWIDGRASPDSGSWIGLSNDGVLAWGSLASNAWARVPNVRAQRLGPWRPGGTEAWVVVSNRWHALRPSDGRLGPPILPWHAEGHGADGRSLLAIHTNASHVQLHVWREASPTPLEVHLPIPTAQLSWASVAPGGQQLAVAWFHLTNGLRVRQLGFWSLDPVRPLGSKVMTGWIQALHASTQGGALYLADGRRAELHAPDDPPARVIDPVGDVLHASTLAPDGTTWVAGGENGKVRWRNLAIAGDPPQVREGHAGPVAAVAWVGGHAPVVSFGNDGTVRRWTSSLPSPEWAGTWKAEFGDAVIAPGGAHLLVTKDRDRVAVVQLSSMVETAEVPGAFQPVAPDPDGRHAWYLGPGLRLQRRTWPGHDITWESAVPSTNTPTFVIRAPGHVLLGFEDGPASGLAVVLPLQTNAPIVRIPLASQPRALALHPDGRSLACAYPDASLVVLAIPDGRVLWTHGGAQGVGTALSWSPDGTWLVAGRSDGILDFHRPWEAHRPAEPTRRTAHAGLVTGVMWDRRGSSLVSLAEDGFLRFWDARNFDPLGTWKADDAGLATACLGEGEEVLVTFSLSGRVRRWPLHAPQGDDAPSP